MKMTLTKMMMCMGVGILGYMYLKNNPEFFQSMRNMSTGMKNKMDTMIDHSEKCINEMD